MGKYFQTLPHFEASPFLFGHTPFQPLLQNLELL